ncbi:MAG: hypothetical protein M1826_007151 [Phylliscum demangeonii]|nr:MAG: hypothetical protein M1826_007151 [Phylliscum demangeonii]
MASWNWHSWVAQEKRSRVAYGVWLIDSALAIYFNCRPQLELDEVRLPLPADDAAWDAHNAEECASTLGLCGVDAQKLKNTTGSRRARQFEMHAALTALLDPKQDLPRGSTNMYSKFILSHALHVQIWHARRQLGQMSGAGPVSRGNETALRAGMPTCNIGWYSADIDQAPSSWACRHSTGPHQLLEVTKHALEKWKQAWDEDIGIQYPASHFRSAASSRFGFCRDGIHFYWLARAFLCPPPPPKAGRNGVEVAHQHNSDNALWLAEPDTRLRQVFALLQKVKRWVVASAVANMASTSTDARWKQVSDRDVGAAGPAAGSGHRHVDVGSVADIDERYGMDELTLDMKLLFRPREAGG